jgi:hypothetical protein
MIANRGKLDGLPKTVQTQKPRICRRNAKPAKMPWTVWRGFQKDSPIQPRVRNAFGKPSKPSNRPDLVPGWREIFPSSDPSSACARGGAGGQDRGPGRGLRSASRAEPGERGPGGSGRGESPLLPRSHSLPHAWGRGSGYDGERTGGVRTGGGMRRQA